METTGTAILVGVFVVMSVGLMVAAYIVKRKVLAFAAGGAWMLVSAYSYTKYTTEWDISYILFWLAAGFAIISFFEVFALRERKEEGEESEEDEEDRAFREEIESMRQEQERRRSLFGSRRTPRRRMTRWERTGEH